MTANQQSMGTGQKPQYNTGHDGVTCVWLYRTSCSLQSAAQDTSVTYFETKIKISPWWRIAGLVLKTLMCVLCDGWQCYNAWLIPVSQCGPPVTAALWANTEPKSHQPLIAGDGHQTADSHHKSSVSNGFVSLSHVWTELPSIRNVSSLSDVDIQSCQSATLISTNQQTKPVGLSLGADSDIEVAGRPPPLLSLCDAADTLGIVFRPAANPAHPPTPQTLTAGLELKSELK